jgi:hypothetical protein
MEFQKLPERIRSALLGAGYAAEDVKVAIQTAYKPNATLPIIWVVAVGDQLLLCNTHRTRWLWKCYDQGNLNCIRRRSLAAGTPAIEILENTVGGDVVMLPLPSKTLESDIDRLIQITNGISRLSG